MSRAAKSTGGSSRRRGDPRHDPPQRQADRGRRQDPPGLFLFNHFTADDPEVAARLELIGWYAAETGLDNSTLLQPIGDAPYALVNHARWDHGLVRFAAHQFTKPSFLTFVRANLRANDTESMPVLYKLA